MPTLHPLMLLELSWLSPEDPFGPTLYAGLGEGKWTEEHIEAFELLGPKAQRRAIAGHMQAIPTPSPELPRDRRKSRKRDARLRKRRIVPGLRFVRRHALDPFLDARLSKGACLTLLYLLARCGKKKTFRAATCWVAEDRAVTTRTIQNHYGALEQHGYIVRSKPDARGITAIYLTPACEPPPFQKKGSPKSTNSAAEGAKISSPTQPMKEDSQKDSGDDFSGEVTGCGLEAENPGAELSVPAQPLGFPLGREMNPESLRERERRQRPGDRPGRVFGVVEEPSEFDQAMARILGRVEQAYRERGGASGGS
jgi:hypothetical protein